jgi:dipeptidyl aminopeptidase/acylaminoacyl peptidase
MLAPGTRLGPYELLSLVGAGGMGEVYRARDTKLDRDVALKVLTGSMADDPAALARFQREARVVAALSHPNILAVHDVGRAPMPAGNAVEYAVMELVDGETLRKKFEAGPLPPRKAIEYALQVARGLAAAHEKGIVHRDIKPENLVITPDGRLRILDFGLAHLTHATASPAGVGSPTPTVETMPGVIVGTIAYMSPEQVRGREVDGESDIFSLGVVLYEMLAGLRPFRGDSAADVMGSILRDDPPDFPAGVSVPQALERVVRRCLEKQPAERYHSARDLAFTLEAIAGASSSSAVAIDVRAPGQRLRKMLWTAAALVVGVVLGSVPQVVARLRTVTEPPVRLHANLPGTDVVRIVGASGLLAISPDGQTLVYTVGNGPSARLDRRSMADGQVAPIPGSSGASTPFFSSDNQWLGFFTGAGQSAGPKLWKVPIAGGAPAVISDTLGGFGASWGDDGMIVLAPSFDVGLCRVPAAGGVCEPLTTLAKDEGSHVWPDILPGSKAVIYTAEVSGQPYDNARIMVRPLPSGSPRVLIQGGSGARYVRSGHLLFGRANKLMAVPFDANRLVVTGPPVPVLDGVGDDPSVGAVSFSVAERGTLAYIAGGGPRSQRSVVLVDRRGATQPVGHAGRLLQQPRLSPDEAEIVMRIDGANNDLWVYDVTRSTLSRRTFEGENFAPGWTPDGKRLIFVSNRTGSFNVFSMDADGGTSSVDQLTRLTSSPPLLNGWSISPDGTTVAFARLDPKTGQDIWMMRLDGDRAPRPIVQTPFGEQRPQIAPDGRHMAYQSNESGQYEVYVQPFPGPGAKRPISVNGGVSPMWSRDGRELFFIQGDSLMTARVELGASFSAAKPQVLFTGMNKFLPDYDVTRDGRFLMIQRAEEETSTREIGIIVNFVDQLKRLAPAGQ